MWHKILRTLGLGLALLVVSAMAAVQAVPADPAGFINDLGRQAIGILQSQPETAGRKAAFSKLFVQDFDVPAIGKFVLGRYWRTATPKQQADYLNVFGQYVVAVYADRFSTYSGEQFTVTGSRQVDTVTSTVSSQIIRTNGGPPIKIDWQVAREGDGYKITNVMVENLSMAITQREEFASVIEQNGGNVDALISLLKQKVESSAG